MDHDNTLDMILAHRHLLDLSRAQHGRMVEVLTLQRKLYNAALQERRDAWRLSKVSISYEDQTASLTAIRAFDAAHAALPHSMGRWILRRVNDAMNGFFSRVKAGRTPGFPRFRSEARFDTFGMADMDGCRIQGSKLLIKGFYGALRMRLHCPIPDGAKIKAITFTREGRRWFVQLTLDVAVSTRHARPGTACGVDVGVEALATLSDGTRFANGRPRSARSAELKRASQALSRAKRGSRRRRKVRERLRAIQRDVANARRDRLHKISKAIADGHELVAVERLNLRNMTRSASGTLDEPGTNVAAKRGLNRALADAAPGRLISMIRYKAERAGGVIVEIDPRGTSQTCPSCGAKVAKALSQRRHVCRCGADMHRDHAAAMVILERGLAAAHAGGTARADAKSKERHAARPKARPGSAKPLAA